MYRSANRIGITLALLSMLLPALVRAEAPLASGVLTLLGAHVEVQAPPDVPLQAEIALPTRLVDSDGNPVDPAGLFGATTVQVRGTLVGDGVGTDGSLDLEPVALGSPLLVPPLTRAGTYVVDHLRLTDPAGAQFIQVGSRLSQTCRVVADLNSGAPVFTWRFSV